MNVFFEPFAIYTGILVTFAIGALLWWSERRKKKRLEQFAASKLLPDLSSSHSQRKTALRNLLLGLTVLLLFISLARPQWGSRQRQATPTGIDVLIALDVSKSMLARDVQPNRIERVKLGISNLLDKLKGDRLGLIAFAGTSFLQCPLTLDHSAFERTLREMEVGVIKRHGTDLAMAIEEAERSFSQFDKDRFLILISDGEDLEQGGLRKAKEAAKENIRIYTIGIGSKEGAPIPLDPPNKPARKYLKDINGKTVLTKLDNSNLTAIARATGGKYYSLGPTGEGLGKVIEELQGIGRQKRHALLTEKLPIERYQVFLLCALLFLAGEFLLSNRRKTKIVESTLALFLLFLFPGCLREDNVKQAEQAYDAKAYNEAADLYELEFKTALAQNEKADPQLYINAGLSSMEAGNLERAQILLEDALDRTVENPELQSITLNALGNLHYSKANSALGNQDVANARKAWETALKMYAAAAAIDGNPKAKRNQADLVKQLEGRIKGLISSIHGIVWRDIDGNGRPRKNEPRLPAKIFWDKNGDGEHNATLEPFVETGENGSFNIEWVSGAYPASFQLDAMLSEGNATKDILLLPILPAAPPPLDPTTQKTRSIILPKAKSMQVNFPFRAAPILKGTVWNDSNQNGKMDEEESGVSEATLFLDLDGDLSLDENETSFTASETGIFNQAVPPGQYTICVKADGKNAGITFPRGDAKCHHVILRDFETFAEHLNFGIHNPDKQEQDNQENTSDPNNTQSEDTNPPPQKPDEAQNTVATTQQNQSQAKQEVNALYERLLQEVEATSEPLQIKGKVVQTPQQGRDY